MTKKNLACIIPCYNEKNNLHRICSVINNINNPNIHWYILNNGSNDIDRKSFNSIITKNDLHKRIYIKTIQSNLGYGYGLKRTILQLEKSYELICWTHADGQTPIEDVSKAYEISQYNRAGIIKGLRTKREDGWIASCFTLILNMLLMIKRKYKIRSPNSQPTLISAPNILKLVESAPDDGKFDISVMLNARRHKLNIQRFPVEFLKRSSGSGENESIKQKLAFAINTFFYLILH